MFVLTVCSRVDSYTTLFYSNRTIIPQLNLDVYILISISTPAGRFNRISISIVFESGSTTSINRLCVRISKCSCESLSINVDRRTVNLSMFVGNGTGPITFAPLLSAVSTILLAQ
jgi:hypothetical protein